MPTNKQRREAERRRLERQLQRRREREVRRRKVTLITSISLTVVLIAAVIAAVVGLSSGDNKTTAATTPTAPASLTPSATASPSATAASYPCKWYGDPTSIKQKNVKVPSTTTPPKTGKVSVSVATNRGAMSFTLDRSKAPCTVASFVSLVQQKYYDKTSCHRLVTSSIYVLQCGDPSAKGTGGPGYSIPDEATGNEDYPAGTIAMARGTSPNSGGSQFFIVYKNSPNLMQNLGSKQYTVFGQVSTGLTTVAKVAAGGSNNAGGTGDGAPKLAITIDSMTTAK